VTKNNKSGFSALPGGSRYRYGDFLNVGSRGRWWSATELDASRAYNRRLSYVDGSLYRSSSHIKSCGFSVRLLRDN
jgi:uncharacterized protein (TIGR02145 family)